MRIAVAMTFTCAYMPRAISMTYRSNEQTGLLSQMGHLMALCEGPGVLYPRVVVLPRLDHANPRRDRSALTEDLSQLGSVTFDAQRCAFEDNLVWTRNYVATYAEHVLVEGIIGPVSVACDAHVEKAVRCLAETSVDCLVADLDTEQQATSVGGARYQRKGTQELTCHLAGARFVLHGTSCLRVNERQQLATDGIIRVSMCGLGSLAKRGRRRRTASPAAAKRTPRVTSRRPNRGSICTIRSKLQPRSGQK